MTNAITTRRNGEMAITPHLGDKQLVVQVRNRILAMMPGAADAPQDVVWAAAQLAVAHRLNPFVGQIYIMKLGAVQDDQGKWHERWTAHIGIKGLRVLARRQSNFMVEFNDMDVDELKRRRGRNYHEDDVGQIAILYRLDVARECKELGIPYKPVYGAGVWRRNARYNKKEQKHLPDNVPETWSPVDVAQKRAEINAIKVAFDIDIDVGDPAVHDEQTIEYEIEQHVQRAERDEAPLAPHDTPPPEEDGDILYA